MRSYIRHPSDITIEFQFEELVEKGTDYLKNVSHGGLSFHSKTPLPMGAVIKVKIPLVRPVFQAVGKVTWCHPDNEKFEIGVQFLDKNDVFRARMVEQICHIEQYKQEILEKEGRQLNGEQAAAEWIKRFAIDFPDMDDDDD